MKKLNKEQIIKGIVHPFIVLLAFVLQKAFENSNDKELVQDILDETAASISLVKEKLTKEIPLDEAVDAGFDIADTITDATETEVDDAVIESAKGVYEAVTGKGGGLIAAIKGFISIHKAKKADGKATE